MRFGNANLIIADIFRVKCSIKQQIDTKNRAFRDDISKMNNKERNANDAQIKKNRILKILESKALLPVRATIDKNPHLHKAAIATDNNGQTIILGMKKLRYLLLGLIKTRIKIRVIKK